MSHLLLASEEREYMAERFYGYGRWDAPYWFVGPEAGMGRDGKDGLAARYESWKQLGCGSVVDCAAHHLGFGFTKWHRSHPPTQATWRQLIRALLAYKGLPTGTETIRQYQRDKWGTSMGETCVIELSGLAAPNTRTEQNRTTFLSRRVERVRKVLAELNESKKAPEFILMYGQGNRAEWEQIAGAGFDSNGLLKMGKTISAIALHPATRALGNEYWVKLGNALRDATRETT